MSIMEYYNFVVKRQVNRPNGKSLGPHKVEFYTPFDSFYHQDKMTFFCKSQPDNTSTVTINKVFNYLGEDVTAQYLAAQISAEPQKADSPANPPKTP